MLRPQRDYLQRRLPDATWYGVGRQDGDVVGEQSTVAIRGDELAVVEWQTRWLSLEPDSVGSVGWDARLPRVATVVRLSHSGCARQIGVINTHFDHAGEQSRRAAAALIGSWVDAEPELAWIVMGDLNAVPQSEPLRLLADAGLRSALPPEAGGTEHAWTGRVDRRRIDHILIDRHWDVVSAAVDYRRPGGVLLSDHWPVRAVLGLG